jgi:7,8-dihydroneopterin aldolase/epimerase/oxygenase
MDIVYIHDLKIDTVIGIYDWERTIKQTVRLDIEMAHDISIAGDSDRIDDTLNYKDVAKRVIHTVESSQFELIEALAEHVAALILREFSVPWLKLTVGKPGAVTGSREVGVIIERSA